MGEERCGWVKGNVGQEWSEERESEVGTRLGSCWGKEEFSGKWEESGSWLWCVVVGRSWKGANGVGENNFLLGLTSVDESGQGMDRVV